MLRHMGGVFLVSIVFALGDWPIISLATSSKAETSLFPYSLKITNLKQCGGLSENCFPQA